MNLKLVPAANKNWLVYGLGIFLLLIGVGLTYRQVTGNTAADQRQQAKLAKAAQELANKPAPSGEGFSARLDNKRKEVESQEAQQKKVDAAAAKALNPAVTASLPMPAVSAAKAHSDLPSDAELSAYAASKEAQALREAKDSSRRLGSWEGGAKPLANLMAGDDLDAPSPSRATASVQQAKPTSTADMVAAYLRQQQQGGAGQAAMADPEGDFLKKAGDRSKSVEPIRAQRGHGRYALLEGSMLEVAMLTGVSSDVGGQCKAQVVRDVFDTVTGMDLLVPAGATLICTYNSAVQAGQERLLMAFTRLIYPNNGATVSLGAMQGGDMQGVMGAPAEVNSRFWKIFGSSLLVASVATYAQIEQAKAGNGSGNGAVVNVGGVVSSTTASVLADVTSKMLARNTNIKPELKLRAGDRLTVIVSQDMVLDPVITGVRR